MNLEQFCLKADLLRRSEIEKVSLLAFFFFRSNGLQEFNIQSISSWFFNLNLPTPNMSRLITNLRKSGKFIRGNTVDAFRLHAQEIASLDSLFPELRQKSEEIVTTDTVLPSSLYSNTRGFIESLAKQINVSYEHNIFDGCAVLMRRLIEVLLILTYQHLRIEDHIKDLSGNLESLNNIIINAKCNRTLNLTSSTKKCIDKFRVIGNFSAHRIYYNARRADIDKIALDFRAAIEELLYKASIKT